MTYLVCHKMATALRVEVSTKIDLLQDPVADFFVLNVPRQLLQLSERLNGYVKGVLKECIM